MGRNNQLKTAFRNFKGESKGVKKLLAYKKKGKDISKYIDLIGEYEINLDKMLLEVSKDLNIRCPDQGLLNADNIGTVSLEDKMDLMDEVIEVLNKS